MVTPRLGDVIGGKYRLLRPLGRGGMGSVYEAENTISLKLAAVKWLHADSPIPGRSLQRLLHEAQASSRIRHENVVIVYDVVDEAEAVFLVMELLHGEPLSRLLERAGLPLHRLIGLLLPAMRGVAAAHAAGVVHRDIKPDNIIMAEEPGYAELVPKVIDFGISKMFGTEGASFSLSGITMGTPKYVSYEQLLGSREVDGRTDIYAFGVILYEALAGRPPYGRALTFAEQAVRFATRMPTPIHALRPELPPGLAACVDRAVAKERDDRWPSMNELIAALEPFVESALLPATLLARAADDDDTPSLDAQSSTLPPPPAARAAGDASVRPGASGESRPQLLRGSLPVPARSRHLLRVGATLLFVVTALVVTREQQKSPRAEPHPQPAAALGPRAAAAQPSEAEPMKQAQAVDVDAAVRPYGEASLLDEAPLRPVAASPSPAAPGGKRAKRAASAAVVMPLVGTLTHLEDAGATARPAPSTQDAGAPAHDERHRAGQLRRREF